VSRDIITAEGGRSGPRIIVAENMYNEYEAASVFEFSRNPYDPYS